MSGFSIGKYLGVESIVHRMSAAAKLLIFIAFSLVLFIVPGWVNLGVCCAFVVVAYMAAHIGFAYALRGIKPVLYVVVFTLIINCFTFSADPTGGNGALPLIGSFGISANGALTGVFFSLRIVAFIAASSLITYTSTLVEIADGVRKLLAPFARLGLPVEDIAITCALTLRFIPSTVEEAERISKAQQARGLVTNGGSIMARAMAWVPIIRPLFIGLFRHAETIGAAMDARCYTGLGRTHLKG